MKGAILARKGGGGAVDCFLCEFRCRIADGKRGMCCVRENRGGTLYTLVYERAISAAVDPIEKKPFYHFLPGSDSFSVATVGCNFRCLHCQNWRIAQLPRDHGGEIEGETLPCGEVVESALRNGCASVSYTYTEPTVFIEYALGIAALAKGRGLRNNFVTNGYMTPEALDALQPVLDAANVDLKGFDEARHRRRTGAGAEPCPGLAAGGAARRAAGASARSGNASLGGRRNDLANRQPRDLLSGGDRDRRDRCRVTAQHDREIPSTRRPDRAQRWVVDGRVTFGDRPVCRGGERAGAKRRKRGVAGALQCGGRHVRDNASQRRLRNILLRCSSDYRQKGIFIGHVPQI